MQVQDLAFSLWSAINRSKTLQSIPRDCEYSPYQVDLVIHFILSFLFWLPYGHSGGCTAPVPSTILTGSEESLRRLLIRYCPTGGCLLDQRRQLGISPCHRPCLQRVQSHSRQLSASYLYLAPPTPRNAIRRMWKLSRFALRETVDWLC